MITQITDLVLLIVLKIVNKLFVQKTSFPFHYPLSLEFFLKILRFYRLHEACYGGFSLIRAIVLIFLLATVYLVAVYPPALPLKRTLELIHVNL